MKKIFLIVTILCINLFGDALEKMNQKEVDEFCSGLERAPAIMAFGELERINKITYETWDKENSNVEILLSKKIQYALGGSMEDEEFYRQVYKITFKKLDGKEYKMIVDYIASSYECSIDGPDVYLLIDPRLD